MKNILVVYLAREQHLYDRFIESYLSHKTGRIEHEFILLFKGNKVVNLRLHNNLQMMHISDEGKSIRAFSIAAKSFLGIYSHICFLNSYSVIRCDNWLSKLYAPFSLPNVGATSCTGSHESFRSNKPKFFNRFLFPKFPNPHIRTTGCLIKTYLAAEFFPTYCFFKWQEHLFESGRWNLTRKLNKIGYKTYVVSDQGYFPTEISYLFGTETYRYKEQKNLLISDNKTDNFLTLPTASKEHLSRCAWGNNISHT